MSVLLGAQADDGPRRPGFRRAPPLSGRALVTNGRALAGVVSQLADLVFRRGA